MSREVEVRLGGLGVLDADIVAVPIRATAHLPPPVAELDEWLEGALSRLFGRAAFRPADATACFAGIGLKDRPDVLAVGLGEDGEPMIERIRRAAGVAARRAREHGARSLTFLMVEEPEEVSVWQGAAEGLCLGDWSYDDLFGEERRARRPEPLARVSLVGLDGGEALGEAIAEAVARGCLLARVQNQARRLVAEPSNVVTPCHLAEYAQSLATRAGLAVRVWGPRQLSEKGFGALLAVAKGSQEEPRFIILEHEGAGGEPYVIVGKGVTFDSGGISLKPASGMEDMKYDMAGAAAALGALEGAARLGLKRRVIGLIAATENLPSGSALKPGDVIKGLSGTSIEVVNTDAEGRLVLSDALSFGCRLGPEAMVDLATLTGGCVVALGRHAIGMMSPDRELAGALEAAGVRSGERVWRLPLWKEYRRQLDSEIADIKNSGGREGSPITGGAFLGQFVSGTSWAHLDIAGTAWAEEDGAYQPKGATGVGVRLLLEWLRDAD
ncbi:MAG: leucyl aminopeptidase [Gemmatimonadota bacterium]